jgi:cathepsin F
MMKYFVLALFAAAAVSAMPLSDEFDNFRVKFGKTYTSPEETEIRRAVFAANVAKIASLNAMKDGAVYGVNEFADLTEDEFRSQKLGFTGGFACKGPQADTDSLPAADASVDWRAKGAVTPVKNQGQCGSCWAFSTTGDIEGTTFLATGKLPELSEQDLVDCDKVDQGCGGGLMDQAMETVIKAGGLESESEYPYKGVGGSCQFSKSKVVANISSYECVKTDETAMAAYVSKNGPLSIALNAGPMQFYMGGVADPLFCSPSHLDHGVLIVGYGTEGSKDYWIIKNSWGETWGEKGYYRIIRGKGKCGLDKFPVHSIH